MIFNFSHLPFTNEWYPPLRLSIYSTSRTLSSFVMHLVLYDFFQLSPNNQQHAHCTYNSFNNIFTQSTTVILLLLCNFLSLWLQMFTMNDEELKFEQQKPTMTLNFCIYTNRVSITLGSQMNTHLMGVRCMILDSAAQVSIMFNVL